jgi:hypothetical protein
MMNVSEKWILREIPGIKNERYFMKKLTDSSNGLEILMADGTLDKKKRGDSVKINFGFVESYRFCDELYRTELFKRLSEKYGTSFYAKKKYFCLLV